jgi:glycosyltransferase involved in cell wall biosynthesis
MYALRTMRAAAQSSAISGTDHVNDCAHMRRRLLAVTPADHPGGAETTPLHPLHGLTRRAVLPSCEEPFGTALAEAMAVGTPVVATRVNGLPEVVSDGVTGRLVAPGDPVRPAEAVVEVLGRRLQMGIAARQHARRIHSEEYVERVRTLIAT